MHLSDGNHYFAGMSACLEFAIHAKYQGWWEKDA